jgi:murein DD-endopeptidase MepM/ murein hydrolase activator NlpD
MRAGLSLLLSLLLLWPALAFGATPPATSTATATATASTATAPLIEVTQLTPHARTGKLFAVDVFAAAALPRIAVLRAAFGHKIGIAFATSDDGHHFRALVPVDIEAKLKPEKLILEADFVDGRTTRWEKPIAVKDGGYDKRNITVGKQFTSPSKAQRLRAEKESAALTAALATTSTTKLWRGAFIKPTAGAETSPFGTLRTYNKKRRSRHLGLDLDGNTGDAIIAANRGRVLLATERFYSGGTVVLDHGQGFITMYFHMSRIDVTAGQLVDKGAGLGAVGASGQVTGPHLHWSVRMGGEYQDPAHLLQLALSSDVDDASAQRTTAERK